MSPLHWRHVKESAPMFQNQQLPMCITPLICRTQGAGAALEHLPDMHLTFSFLSASCPPLAVVFIWTKLSSSSGLNSCGRLSGNLCFPIPYPTLSHTGCNALLSCGCQPQTAPAVCTVPSQSRTVGQPALRSPPQLCPAASLQAVGPEQVMYPSFSCRNR